MNYDEMTKVALYHEIVQQTTVAKDALAKLADAVEAYSRRFGPLPDDTFKGLVIHTKKPTAKDLP